MENTTRVKEHILVCLSSSPSNPKVIKTASKMVRVFDAEFTALFVETSQIKKMTAENKERLSENAQIAKQNGAKIVTIDGDDIAYQVSQYAKQSKVTKIIIGRSGYKANRFFAPPNFVDKIIELSPDIEVYIIPDKIQKPYTEQNEAKKNKLKTFKLSFVDIIKSILILALSTIIGEIFHKLNIAESNIILIYILGVILISYVTESKIYSVVSSVLSVLIFNFLFTEPYFSLKTNNPHEPLTFIIMFIVAIFTSHINQKVKAQSKQASLKAYNTEVMLEMSQKIQQGQNRDEITNITTEQIKKLLSCNVKIIMKDDIESNLINEELEIINWVIDNNKQAGVTTEYFSKSENFYIPIGSISDIFAIAIIKKNNITEFEKNLLIAMVREAALAYEKNYILQSKNQLLLKNEQEKLRSNLLRSISHDLRTPLTSISGFADILINNSQIIKEEKKQQIYSDIYEDSIWLLNLVENILAITRFDKKEIELKKESEYVYDVILESLSHLGRKKDKFNIKIDVEDESIAAKMDAKLIAQVIFNLVDNATKYSTVGTTITVNAKIVEDKVKIMVADEGNGISDEDKKKIFDAFYTVNTCSTDGRRGLGLGLALCKDIINAHDGELIIEDNIPKGTIFSFLLENDMDKD